MGGLEAIDPKGASLDANTAPAPTGSTGSVELVDGAEEATTTKSEAFEFPGRECGVEQAPDAAAADTTSHESRTLLCMLSWSQLSHHVGCCGHRHRVVCCSCGGRHTA